MTDTDYQFIEFVDGLGFNKDGLRTITFAIVHFEEWLANNQDKLIVSVSHAFQPTGQRHSYRRILVVYRDTSSLKT